MINKKNMLVFLGILFLGMQIAGANSKELDKLDKYNVVWNTLGKSAVESMPLGNGDIALNVWTEKNGDLVFYIGKNDAWCEETRWGEGLLKLGRVRVSLDPNPFAAGKDFTQSLILCDGAMVVKAGNSQLRIWVDANRPVVHVDADCAEPVKMRVALESWRREKNGGIGTDKILDNQTDRVAWYYRVSEKDVPQRRNNTIGAIIEGEKFKTVDALSLEAPVSKKHHVAVHPLVKQSPEEKEWLEQIEKQVAKTKLVSRVQAWQEHCKWWQQFWNRSWIFVSGNKNARAVTEGYLLQRFKQACTSRGDYPIKFNGSLFTIDGPNPFEKGKFVTADYRSWGGQYWFQNTRAMYWPMLVSGDFDLMQPLFRMYRAMLEQNSKQVREFYGHDGFYFRETAPFWGGLVKLDPKAKGTHTHHYYTPVLELSAMMLDYFNYTGDKEFARQTLLPMADGGVTFFFEHFPREENGQLRIEPSNAVETYWKVRNPLTDVAGLTWVLQGLIKLPSDLTTEVQRKRWKKMLGQLPPVPVGMKDGKKMLRPFQDDGKEHKVRNMENPELYAIFPFRLYGVGKPDLDLAKAAYAARRCKATGCWRQDAIQAAFIGDAKAAQKDVTFNLTNKDKRMKFPAFWANGFDYVPDEDNGGVGINALQLMLIQSYGKAIRLLPAWPKGWNASFKLHAPYKTTVEGWVENGKVVDLKVTPESRKKDVIVMKNK